MTTPLKVMYIEDDLDIQTVVKMALETVSDMSVQICSSGEEALEKVVSFMPDLILLDVMMPVMDGPATLKAFREIPQIKSTPVVFMTAKVQPTEIDEYRALGAADIIIKPFDPMLLADQVKAIWQQCHGTWQ